MVETQEFLAHSSQPRSMLPVCHRPLKYRSALSSTETQIARKSAQEK